MDYKGEIFRELVRNYQRKVDTHKQAIDLICSPDNPPVLKAQLLMTLGKAVSDAEIDGYKQNIDKCASDAPNAVKAASMTSALMNARIKLAKAAVRMDLQGMFLMGLGKVASDAEIDALIENMPEDFYCRLVARRM